jgi:hypothetical protein
MVTASVTAIRIGIEPVNSGHPRMRCSASAITTTCSRKIS